MMYVKIPKQATVHGGGGGCDIIHPQTRITCPGNVM